MSLRATHVMALEKCFDRRIDHLSLVRELSGSAIFSAIVIVRDQRILHESYAADFGPNCPHSIQSISKTIINLIVGKLVEGGSIRLDDTVETHVPDIGSGYRGVSIQQVLNMDVANEYNENYEDPLASSYLHEVSMGWRLAAGEEIDETQTAFIKNISSPDTTNYGGQMDYKSANTEVLGLVIEAASGRTLRSFLVDIVEAAGLENALYITTDREGVPSMNGGCCLTARDLARFGSLFIRRGVGIHGQRVGCRRFIERSLKQGLPMPAPRSQYNYSNHMFTNGRWLGHSGYGGQFMLADLKSGVVGVFLAS